MTEETKWVDPATSPPPTWTEADALKIARKEAEIAIMEQLTLYQGHTEKIAELRASIFKIRSGTGDGFLTVRSALSVARNLLSKCDIITAQAAELAALKAENEKLREFADYVFETCDDAHYIRKALEVLGETK